MNERRKSGRGQKRSGRRSRRKQGGAPAEETVAAFWGDPGALPPSADRVRITKDPSAVVRSLGRPPLPGHETIAGHYFDAVYDRTVTLAAALAAAGELIEPDELVARDAEDGDEGAA